MGRVAFRCPCLSPLGRISCCRLENSSRTMGTRPASSMSSHQLCNLVIPSALSPLQCPDPTLSPRRSGPHAKTFHSVPTVELHMVAISLLCGWKPLHCWPVNGRQSFK
jgi:hypothetical protein